MNADDEPMTGASPTQPLVLTADPRLRDEIERLCAAAGLAPFVVAEPTNARHRWSNADCVVAGDDVAAAVATAGLPSRSGVVLVTESAVLDTWQRAVELRAEAVVELPAERPRLADFLADRSRSDRGHAARVVGLVGARGGVGTSTTAAMLGLVATAMGHVAVLIDADRDSSGLDLLLGCESADGLRWPDVAAINGRVGASALRSSLPAAGGLPVLTWAVDGAIDLPRDAMGAIVTAAARGSELVVIDLGRRLDGDNDGLLGQIDVILLVAGGDLLSAAATNRLVSRLRARCSDLRLVVRDGQAGAVDPHQLGAAVDLDIGAVSRHTRRADRAINDGLGPFFGRRDRRSMRRLVDDLLVRPVR